MEKIKVKDILKIMDGELIFGNKDIICENFKFDTRDIEVGDIFIRVGDEKKEGKKYWEMAFEAGAIVCIVNNIENNLENFKKWDGKCLIKVQDTLKGLQELAKYRRNLYGKDFSTVAITGSVGKTSTKDMLANVLSQKYKTLKTKANYNNHIGVPFTVLGLKDHEAAVIEMGMNHFGEIRELTKIAKPKISVITNIGTSHIGNLGSRENILKAKLEILEGMDEKVIVINNDNDLLHKWKEENQEKDIKIYTFGIENKSDVWAEKIKLFENESEFRCHIFEENYDIKVPVGGIHFVYNALCAGLVGYLLGLKKEEIKKGIEGFKLTKNRMEISKLKNGALVINDSYNASLESIKASIKTLEEYKERRKIAVIGDVFELGKYSEELHRKIGRFIKNSKIDILLCTGENSKYIVEEAKKEKSFLRVIKYFNTKEEILNYLKKETLSKDVILFKASHGMKFYELCPKENECFEDIKL